jgi:type II secretory pathway component GspD/PulD (secretin)
MALGLLKMNRTLSIGPTERPRSTPNKQIIMKAKFAIVTIVGLTACTLALAQNEPAAETPAPATATAAPAAAGPATIPLIQFQDVPLTTAIDNLARQASINYILDPKVGYGQPDERGQLRGQPNISIRWENLTAEQALNALITTYGLQLIEDQRTKIARVTIKDPAAPEPLQTRIIQLKYAAPSNILAAVQTVLSDKRSKVVADVRTSQLVVSATERELDAVDKLVTRLDTQTKQVLIEGRLVETSKNPRSVKGIDWTGTLQGQQIAYGNNNQTKPVNSFESVNPPLATLWPKIISEGGSFNPATAFLNADGVNAVFSFMNNDSATKILSTPRAVTLDNEEAMLSVTRAFPIFKNTAGTQGSPGGSEVTYTNLGTILKVRPRISANDFINLKVQPEVSSKGETIKKIVADTVNEADVYDIRSIQTEVMIPSGNTLVLGGLVSSDNTKSYAKVPLLGDIPGLGWAFRHESKDSVRKNLIIFITPTIVKDSDYQPTTSDFLKSRIDDAREPEPGFMDSGKPAGTPPDVDWSRY